MNIYQIIGTIWLINTIVIGVVMTDIDGSSKNILFIAKFVNKYGAEFAICFIVSIIISICLLQIEVK